MPPPPMKRQQPTNTRAPIEEEEGLRAYTHHGMDLTPREHDRQGVGDCPFCNSSTKFTVEVSTSKFRCWSCGITGNALSFIRLLHETSVKHTPSSFIEEVVRDRGFTDPATVTTWGVCRSIIPPHPWLVPGYDIKGVLTQLYKRTHLKGSDNKWSWRLLPTPGVWGPGKVHAFHMVVTDFDTNRQGVDIMEGPWDGMAYWEVVQQTAAAGDSNVIAVPGCNVWRDEWTNLCKGKDVTIWFDSDHPKSSGTKDNGRMTQPGLDGVQRVASRLSGHALSVNYVKWGEGGYDATRPDGWDVRDALSSHPDRLVALSELLPLIEPVPSEWFSSHQSRDNKGVPKTPTIEPEACHEWSKCLSVWKNALEWRQELTDVLATMLAVATSTNQSGDNQLFLMVIADPGSAKTRLCKGMLVSRNCKQLLHLKSFHSGYKKEGGEDCSFVSRIGGLCLITPEADALTIGGNAEQLDSQARQIFDGETGNTYGNSDEDRQYKGIRCSWIKCGTPTLMDKDQSRLGDRYLRIRIEQPEEEVKQAILMRALNNELSAVTQRSNGTEASIIPPKLRKAYAITGGYVDWLFANAEEKLDEVERNMSQEYRQQVVDLGILAAEMRARPNMDPKKTETFPTKELPTRLVSQLGRLALCISVVMNKEEVDDEVMRVVRKVALDTAYGHTLNMVTWMCASNPGSPSESYQETGGIQEKRLAAWCNMNAERMSNYLSFLRKIGVMRVVSLPQGGNSWTLTDRIYTLYLRVMSR